MNRSVVAFFVILASFHFLKELCAIKAEPFFLITVTNICHVLFNCRMKLIMNYILIQVDFPYLL